MSSETWKLEKDLCRCCHSEGSFKNLAEPHITTGLSKVYADMLKECYQIDMSPIPGSLCMATYTICEACVIRLQDAVDFKTQVLKCERRFQEMFNRNCIIGPFTTNIVVKQEFPDSDPEDHKVEFPESFNDNEDSDKSMELRIDEEAEDDIKEVEVVKKKKYKTRKTLKSKTCKRTKRKNAPEKVDEENDAEKKKGRVVAPKFRLKEDEDYKKNGAKHQCLRCNNTYYTLSRLKNHVKAKHLKIPNYKCSICNEEFITLALFTIHKLKVHNIDDRVKCGVCAKFFNAKKNLMKHSSKYHIKSSAMASKFRVKENEDFERNGAMLQCLKCDKSYKSDDSIKYHVKTKHYKYMKFKCSICNEGFITPTGLTLHKLEVHKVDDRYKCTACNKIFNSRVQYVRHNDNYHMLGKKIKCDTCDYEAYSAGALYRHKISHKTVKEHQCRFCKKAFMRKTTLNFHERIHTGDKRKLCNECGQAFVQKASLNYHMAKYHPEVKF